VFVESDLHGHTFFSDGRSSPEEYVEHRRQLAFRAIAVSDHDVLAAVPRAAAAAAAARLLFLPAVEVTSFLHFGTDAAEQFHVLAYFPPGFAVPPRLRATALYRRGLRVQERWRAFALTWLDGLGAEDREAVDPDGALARLPAAEFPALQSMFLLLLERRPPLYVAFQKHHRRFWDDPELFGWEPEEAIAQIRADGATDIVAHPARYRDVARTEAVLRAASGLEVYTSRHRPEVAERYREFARANRKLWTASTDDHRNATFVRPASGTPVTTLEHLVRDAVGIQQLYAMSSAPAA